MSDRDRSRSFFLGLGTATYDVSVRDPFGNILGVVQNPHFRVAP